MSFEWSFESSLSNQPAKPSDPKHGREVCRYWLHSKCMKGTKCEFLHSLDYAKMPVCHLGDACTSVAECPFRHLDVTRDVCANYELGFCSFGRRCPHKHVKKPAADLPEVSTYWTPSYVALARAKQQASANPTFRKKACDYFVRNGWCPYFDMCNFQHGQT